MSVYIGEMTTWVDFQKPVRTMTNGVARTDWVNDFGAWCNLRPIAGTENDSAQQTQAMVMSLMRLRFDERVKRSLRGIITEDGFEPRVLELVSVLDENSRHEYLLVTCRETVK